MPRTEGSLWGLLRRGTWAEGCTSIALAIPRPGWASGMSMSPDAMGIPASLGTSPSLPGSGEEKSSLPGLFTSAAPSTGLSLHSQASPKACLHLLSSLLTSISSSTHCFLPSLLRRAALTKVGPLLGRLKNWMEEAEEPPRTTTLDQALLPDGHLASPDWPVTSLLVWAEATSGIFVGRDLGRNPSPLPL